MHRKQSNNVFPKANIHLSDIFLKKYKNFLGKKVSNNEHKINENEKSNTHPSWHSKVSLNKNWNKLVCGSCRHSERNSVKPVAIEFHN